MTVSDNAQQPIIHAHAKPLKDAAKDNRLSTQGEALAQQGGACAPTTFARGPRAVIAANAAPAGPILRSLDRQLAAATPDAADLSRRRANAHKTGRGTVSPLLQAAAAKNVYGSAFTDKIFSCADAGSAAGSRSSVTAVLGQQGHTSQATEEALRGNNVDITGSHSGPNAGESSSATLDGETRTKTGDFYAGALGVAALQQVQSEPSQVQDFFPAPKADAFLAYDSLSADDHKNVFGAVVQILINQVGTAIAGPKDASKYAQFCRADSPSGS